MVLVNWQLVFLNTRALVQRDYICNRESLIQERIIRRYISEGILLARLYMVVEYCFRQPTRKYRPTQGKT